MIHPEELIQIKLFWVVLCYKTTVLWATMQCRIFSTKASQGACGQMPYNGSRGYYIISQSWQCQLLHASFSLHRSSIKCHYHGGVMFFSLAVQPRRFCLHPGVHSLTPTSLSRLQRFCCCSNIWIAASCRCWPSPCFGLFTTRPAGNTTAGNTHDA